MANPAALLHQQLITWRDKHGNGFVDMAEQRRAAKHLDAIENLLTQMSDAGIRTKLFERHFPKWATLVYHHPHDWNNKNTNRHVDDVAIENLEHLADRLDGLAPTLNEGGLDLLREYAAGTTKLVDEDETVNPLLRQHVRQVVAHLNWCIDNYDAVGDFDLQEALDHLIVVMFRAAGNSEDRSRWKAWLNNLVWPFTANAASNIAAAIPAQVAVQLALGG